MFTEHEIKQWFTNISTKKILVIGDFMLDRYIHGKVERISPEAPVPVVQVSQRESRAGGAGNVVINVHTLGAQVIPVSLIGTDESGNELIDSFQRLGIHCEGLIQVENLKTTTKTRVLSGIHQMLRIDDEILDQITDSHRKSLANFVIQKVENQEIDAILFEDYDKGILDESLIQQIVKIAQLKNIPTFVDPKKKNFSAYQNVTVFKPNLKEMREGLQCSIQSVEDVIEADKLLRKKLKNTYTLCTMSEKGVYFSDEKEFTIRQSLVRNLADVSGAGDSVIATMTCLYVAGAEPKIAAQIANIAAGIVCEFPGVVPVDKNRLLQESINYLCS